MCSCVLTSAPDAQHTPLRQLDLWGFDLTELYYWFMWLSTTFAILAVATAIGYFNQSSMLIASDEMMRWFFKTWWMIIPDMLQMVSIVLFLFGMCWCVLLTLPKAAGHV